MDDLGITAVLDVYFQLSFLALLISWSFSQGRCSLRRWVLVAPSAKVTGLHAEAVSRASGSRGVGAQGAVSRLLFSAALCTSGEGNGLGITLGSCWLVVYNVALFLFNNCVGSQGLTPNTDSTAAIWGGPTILAPGFPKPQTWHDLCPEDCVAPSCCFSANTF